MLIDSMFSVTDLLKLSKSVKETMIKGDFNTYQLQVCSVEVYFVKQGLVITMLIK